MTRRETARRGSSTQSQSYPQKIEMGGGRIWDKDSIDGLKGARHNKAELGGGRVWDKDLIDNRQRQHDTQLSLSKPNLRLEVTLLRTLIGL